MGVLQALGEAILGVARLGAGIDGDRETLVAPDLESGDTTLEVFDFLVS